MYEHIIIKYGLHFFFQVFYLKIKGNHKFNFFTAPKSSSSMQHPMENQADERFNNFQSNKRYNKMKNKEKQYKQKHL